MNDDLLRIAIGTARRAGDAILALYGTDAAALKEDGSPLTAADLASHHLIVAALADTGIPVVSEEGRDLRLGVDRYWLVDPLDGTKEFLHRNDEFTVNIALVQGDRPSLGVVFAPALDELYVGGPGIPTWREAGGMRQLHPVCLPATDGYRMAVSRFHDHPGMLSFAAENRVRERLEIGSALKYGRLAMGDVDVFPRLVGSSEWDTAAGQAVVEGAGGAVLEWDTGAPLRYGKPRRRNPRLLSCRAPYAYGDFRLQSYAEALA